MRIGQVVVIPSSCVRLFVRKTDRPGLSNSPRFVFSTAREGRSRVKSMSVLCIIDADFWSAFMTI
jgi:hypothetical protein